jgi:hypothetical protein
MTKTEVVALSKNHNLRGSEKEITAFATDLLREDRKALVERTCFLCEPHAQDVQGSTPAVYNPSLNTWTHHFADKQGVVRMKEPCRAFAIRTQPLFSDGDAQ